MGSTNRRHLCFFLISEFYVSTSMVDLSHRDGERDRCPRMRGDKNARVNAPQCYKTFYTLNSLLFEIICGLYYKTSMIIIYDRNDSCLYYKTMIVVKALQS
jgi:hypothetical protein